jgi:hemerythrin
MDFFEWKASFSIGIKEIDQQHRKFLEYLNECYHTVQSDRKKRIDPTMLAKLKHYASAHFRFEEDLMTAYAYPKYDHQKRQHAYFKEQIEAFTRENRNDSNKSAEKLMAFMRDWFLNHIMVEDRDIAAYLR